MKTFRYRGIPVLGFAAYSNSGKTTLLRKLIPRLSSRGTRCALVKHAHHEFDIDYPGKDSYELRKAGAGQVLVGSGERWAMVVETHSGRDPELTDFLSRIDRSAADLILVEGFRDLAFPKVAIHRQSQDRPPLQQNDEFIIAVVSDVASQLTCTTPVFDIEDSEGLVEFIENYRIAASNA